MNSTIQISSEVFQALDLSQWSSLTLHEIEVIGRHLLQQIQATGRAWDLFKIEFFGPPGESNLVLQVSDRMSGVCFSLIPGGTFHPGISEHLQKRYFELYMLMEGWKARREPDDDRPPWQPELIKATWVFASCKACDLRPRSPVNVPPFFLATQTLPGSEVRWEKVRTILDQYSWRLPTTTEFEWALRGGVDSLFYWGNDFPEWMYAEYLDDPYDPEFEQTDRWKKSFADTMSKRFQEDANPGWPRANRFGLVGMVAASSWCEPSQESSDAYPLIVRGGAAQCYGWQGCGEWKKLLNTTETRLSVATDYADHNGIRPVIALRCA